MIQKSYSLHKIENPDKFTFKPSDYSRFKYGDGQIAEQFGVALAKGFIANHLQKEEVATQIVVLSSPYAFIPTATNEMTKYFIFELNKWLASKNFPVIQQTKIHRTTTYKEDYGALDAAARLALIGNDDFHIDRTFLEGKLVIFIDDIKITGSHERMISRMVEKYELKNDHFFLYFAELVNSKVHPNIENFLNYYKVKSIFDLLDIINNPKFAFNTRIVKFILHADSNAFNVFLPSQSFDFIYNLYHLSIGNGYHLIDAYKTNLATIEKYLMLKVDADITETSSFKH